MQQYETNIVNNITTSINPNAYDEKYVKSASSKLYTYIYLENDNKTKYKSILKNLNQQYSFGKNQYSTSIIEANNNSNSHKFDRNYIKSKIYQRNQHTREKEIIIK